MKSNFNLVIGFAFWGLLMGYITGITSSAVAQTILTSLFAFMGGKMFLDFSKKKQEENKTAGAILFFFSFLFLIGLNAGIFVKINRLLDKNPNKNLDSIVQDYLRKVKIENINEGEEASDNKAKGSPDTTKFK